MPAKEKPHQKAGRRYRVTLVVLLPRNDGLRPFPRTIPVVHFLRRWWPAFQQGVRRGESDVTALRAQQVRLGAAVWPDDLA